MYIISSISRLSVNVEMKVHVFPNIQYSNYAISKTIVDRFACCFFTQQSYNHTGRINTVLAIHVHLLCVGLHCCV